ncbi:unnamed protein product [Candidula unifasciata]|uniref:L-Fucosyltransferase n=1 Tax=Candidula unifasciata TaxID=100452 RepID=A0A8S3ZKJ8_9EUPU|nr:unnamed protein product [Candidula unifasciata]
MQKKPSENTTIVNMRAKDGLTSGIHQSLKNPAGKIRSSPPYVTSDNIWHGRLGNQMFKYASILGISRKQGRTMFIERGTDLEKTFKINYIYTNESIEKWSVIREKDPVAFDKRLMKLPRNDTRIYGFLQSFLYFADVVDEVRTEFTFHDSVANEAATILRDIYIKYNVSTTVGVHVRRGDFLSDYGQYWGYGVPKKSYFTKAFSIFKSKFPERRIVFLVASDDLPWCSKHLHSNDVIVLPPASAAVHLAVLTSCDHMIISGGTFGWWSGWLSNGYVIYFSGYMGNGTRLGKTLTISTYYPLLWVGLGN